MTIYIGIDQSLRSTGLTALKNENLIDFKIIKTFKSITKLKKKLADKKCFLDLIKNDEELLIYIVSEIQSFIEKISITYSNEAICVGLEGISYGSKKKSAEFDLIASLYWYIRIMLIQNNIDFFILPPKKWSSFFLTPLEISIYKEEYKKDYLKKGIFLSLTSENKWRFTEYINNNSDLFEKKDIFDLSDSFSIARYTSIKMML